MAVTSGLRQLFLLVLSRFKEKKSTFYFWPLLHGAWSSGHLDFEIFLFFLPEQRLAKVQQVRQQMFIVLADMQLWLQNHDLSRKWLSNAGMIRTCDVHDYMFHDYDFCFFLAVYKMEPEFPDSLITSEPL